MEINAILKRIYLHSPAPQRMADFYAANYGMNAVASGSSVLCRTTGRQLGLVPGEASQFACAQFEFADNASWNAFLARTEKAFRIDPAALADIGGLPAEYAAFRDPDGNRMVFARASEHAKNTKHTAHAESGLETPALPATLQHFALRTKNIEPMASFYADQLGFVVSDRVEDEQGKLRAIFFRTDNLHHALALFLAPVNCFDHQSYETTDWDTLKAWADGMGWRRTDIVWGVGRHGPGDDVFFMVRDPDGNLVEISSEIEVCGPDRPMGIWPNEEHTLNVWGNAIMRS